MNVLKPLLLGLAIAFSLGGCAGGLGSSDYSRSQARTAQEVHMGVVVAVRNVKIEGTKTPIGTGAGAVVGGVAGSELGGGRGSLVGAVVGAVAGGLAGSAIEEGVTRQNGLEITVRLDSGRTLAVTQADDEDIRVGDRVRVLSGNGVTRVAR
ncbi:MAG TPA: glycine zipper 2TM domain-containing protein [Sulfuriferula sp.]|nr:glycine zipper 2TM domain-containing protein [Sulfuriferula sp.]